MIRTQGNKVIDVKSVQVGMGEWTGKNRLQHGLIVRIQVYQHFLKGIVPLCRYFSPHNSLSFFNSRYGFGVIERVAGYGVAVTGAEGASLNSLCNSHGESIA